MALQNNTLANPRTAFYATATESGKLWYTFPSQTGQVLLNDASGTQVLRAIGGDLFFNDELLAKAGDIQDIADWALYPALQDVNMDGQNLLDVSSAVINNGLSAGNTTLESVIVANGITSNANITTASLQMAGEPIPALGGLTAKTLAASGALTAGSISTAGTIGGGAISGTSITTTGGVDMTNTAITRASSVGISNSGFAPYGSLTSPDGSLLTWNGQTITTGAGGNASQWANYPAIAPIQGNGQSLSNLSTLATTGEATVGTNLMVGNTVNTERIVQLFNPTANLPMTILAQNPAGLLINSAGGGIASTATVGNIESTSVAGDIATTAYNSITMDSGNDISLTANPGLNPLYTAAINLNAKNGNGGQVNIVADPGAVAAFGGQVNITANGGTILIPQPPPAPPLSVTVGGEVNITANSGGSGLYTLTSAVNIGAAGVNSYAGAIPPIGSVAGYNFIYGNAGVNICSGLPSAGFQLPLTTYIYGTGVPGSYGGVRLESGNGIQMLSDTYMQNLYPLDTDGLTIAGRSYLGTGSVYIEDVETFTMNGGAVLKTDNISSVSNSGILYTDNFFPLNNTKGVYANFVKPIQASAPGVPNLVISNNPFLGNNNYVEISGADVIAFDATGAGALSGVKSINGAAWPPPTGDASLWSQYPATSIIDASGFNISNVTTINGAVYPPVTSTADWSNYPAIQNVDISGFDLNNVGNITLPDNGSITSAGTLIISSDGGKNLALASNAGGDVVISTGNQGDINITTGGTGNDVTIAGDIVNLDATLGVRITAPSLDMTGNNVINVNQLTGSSAATLTVASTGVLDVNATGDINVISSGAALLLSGNTSLEIASTGAVNVTAGLGINLLAPTAVGTSITPQNLAVSGAANVTGDVISSFGGSTPYSLNAIGAAVNGVQQYDYWVSVNGSNTTGTGSVLRPFASVTAALAATVSIPDTIPVNINLTAGTYTESPTITRNNTFLVGNVGVADAVIIGTLTFNPTATATVSQGMAGITVVGNVSCLDVSPFDLNWYFQYCNITSYGTTALTATSDASGNNSLIMNNTVVTQNVTANTCIALTSVRLNAIQCQLNNTTTGSCISTNGTGSMSLFGCTLTAAGTATASPLITFISAIANGVASSFQLCTFTYTASTVGAGKTAVFFNNGGALAGLTLFNQNVFNMLGSSSLILRPGSGSLAIQWGTNSSNILTIPAAGAGLTYTYLTSTPLSATALYDSTGSAGTNLQVLGCGAGGGLQWRSLTNTSLGTIPQAASTSAYLNQPLFYNTTTGAINYIAVADDVTVQPCPATFAPIANNKNTTFILTSTGASTFTLNNNAGTPLTANDVGWYMYIKNGNGTLGGDITINGALVSGNTVVHNQTAVQNGQIVIVRWTGTAFVCY
jgi:hypothetical protein